MSDDPMEGDKAKAQAGAGLLAHIDPLAGQQVVAQHTFTPEQKELVKNTVAKGATDLELELFLYQAAKMGLDPLNKEIHFVKREWDDKQGQHQVAVTMQVGIDGMRKKADETKLYVPGPEPEFKYDSKNNLWSATATVLKLVGKEWMPIRATAIYSEYVQMKFGGAPNKMWTKMPHSLLAKCAEALALRKAFPTALAGVYSFEELGQQTDDETPPVPGGLLTGPDLPEEPKRKSEEKPPEGIEQVKFSDEWEEALTYVSEPIIKDGAKLTEGVYQKLRLKYKDDPEALYEGLLKLGGQAQPATREPIPMPASPVSPEDEPVEKKKPKEPQLTPAQLRKIIVTQKGYGVSDEDFHEFLKLNYGVTSRKDIPKKHVDDCLRYMETIAKTKEPDEDDEDVPLEGEIVEEGD